MPALTIGGKTPQSSLAKSATKAATQKVPVVKKPSAAQVAAEKKAAQLSLNNAENISTRFNMQSPDAEAVAQINQNLGYTSAAPVDTMPTTPAWALESDPLYKSALSAGQAQFNYARNAALAEKQTQELGLGTQRKALDTSAAESRRRLAGNYAARGMAGGAAGALALAEAQANAEQVAARTSIADQITALNNSFLQNYGDVSAKNAAGESTYDWTGTLTGQQYKTQAAQAALEAALARYGTV